MDQSFPPMPPTAPPTAAPAAPPTGPPTAPPTAPPSGFATPPFGTPPPYVPASSPASTTAVRATRPVRTIAVVGATVVASLAAGVAGGWVAGRQASDSGTASSAATTTSTTGGSSATTPSRTVNATIGESLDVAAILAKVGPSVVAIETQITEQRGPFVAQGKGAGTGIILSADGEVLTNAHVIEGATDITVTVNGSTTALPAKLVAADTANDLALLRITGAHDLTPATLGSSAEAIVGDDVVAVGNALALEGGMSVTRGIVSALHRSIEAGSETSSESLTGLIQTDAAISSGNSGGPLVNSRGEVIGINTAVAGSSGSTTAQNIGFAIPIDTAKEIVARLRNGN
ncbi:MAG: trypsin-like peptidase domain-containing protein [Acidimicrobiales bacterium]